MSVSMPTDPETKHNVGALIIRAGFWAPLYSNYIKRNPKIVLVTVWAPVLSVAADAHSAYRGLGCNLQQGCNFTLYCTMLH